MKKGRYLLVVILAALCALFAFAACEFGGSGKNGYTITYDLAGGTGNFSQPDTEAGASVTVSDAKPVRSGYEFEGWVVTYSDETVHTVEVTDGAFTMPAANVTITAQWIKIYTVTYDLAGGTGNFTQPDLKAGMPVNIPATAPTREGCVFEGWVVTYSDGSVHTVEVADGSFTMPAADVTITAQWEELLYTVTYDLAGGEGSFTQPDLKGGLTVTIPLVEPTRTGYEFKGWRVTYLDQYESVHTVEVTDGAFTMPFGNVTVTAQWAKLYTVTYDLAGGEGDFAPFEASEGKRVQLPVTRPAYEGNEFKRWRVTYQDGDSTRTVTVTGNAFTMPSANVTVKAVWEEIFTITYDLAGGSGSFSQSTHKENELIYLPDTAPTREGYDFEGWSVTYQDFGGTVHTVSVTHDRFSMPFGDVTITAQWERIVYTVTFKTYGGEYSIAYYFGEKLSDGEGYRVPAGKNGVPFAYWYYVEENEFIKVQQDAVVSELLEESNERSITLSAWNAFVIGKDDLSAAPSEDYTPEKNICDIQKGQLVKISGTMTSKAEENWQTVLTYFYSGEKPKGFFRLDWWVEDGSETTEEVNGGWNPQNIMTSEGWQIDFTGWFDWDADKGDYADYRSTISACRFTLTIDWTHEKEIKIEIQATGSNVEGDINSETMLYTITPSGNAFTNNVYHIGLGADASYAEFTGLNVHAQHEFKNHLCVVCGVVERSALDAMATEAVEGFDTYAPQPTENNAWFLHPSPSVEVSGDFAVKFTYDQGTLEAPSTVIEIYDPAYKGMEDTQARAIYLDANPNDKNYWYAELNWWEQGYINSWYYGKPANVKADAGITVSVYVWRVGDEIAIYYEALSAEGEVVYSFTVLEEDSVISRDETLQVRLNGYCAGGSNWKAYKNAAAE